ncbi:MAG: penicillin-binding protein 2 [Lautropia sp.]|nr:penicillin-binding protein 2 [Lautropia sp.]
MAKSVKSVKFADPQLLQARLQLWRSRFMFGVVFVAFGALTVKAFYLQTASKNFLQAQGAQRYEKTVELQANRGRILDRHGVVLASSLPARSIWAYADRVDLSDPRLLDLARLLNMQPLDLQARLTQGDRSFVFLKRQVDLDTADRIAALRIRGIGQDSEYKRNYPEGETAAHLVGFTDLAHVGQEGLELAFQSTLAGKPGSRRVIRDGTGQIIGGIDEVKEPVNGKDLRLTIDSRIQYHAFQAVKEAVATHQAKSGAAVVLDARNGQILALANWPSYNPADRSTLKGGGLRNRAITDLYEPGSTLKVFTAALALESGKYSLSSMFDAREGFMKIGRDVIRDAHRQKELMTLQQVIQKSSNIGTAQMALNLSPEAHWNLLRSAGLTQAPDIGFPGAAAGRLRPFSKWKPIEHATISYGHGLSVSLLQMARAYTVFAGPGEVLPVQLVVPEEERRVRAIQVSSSGARFRAAERVSGQQVISTRTAATMRQILERSAGEKDAVVKASVPGYRVGGKSGTTKKLEGGKYVKKYISSFVGMAPMSNPRVIVAVMVDEPGSGKYYGSDVAAPVFAKITGESLRTLAVEPDAPFETMISPITPELVVAPNSVPSAPGDVGRVKGVSIPRSSLIVPPRTGRQKMSAQDKVPAAPATPTTTARREAAPMARRTEPVDPQPQLTGQAAPASRTLVARQAEERSASNGGGA